MKKKQHTKVQELVYELRVRDVMKRRVISVAPDTPMADIRSVLRENWISGVPVLDGEKLVGIISIEDFIEWLADDGRRCRVADKMTHDVETLYADEPLVRVVERIDRSGFGRFPVIDRKNRRLQGIVTKGDIIEGLLHKLEIEYYNEEKHLYGTGHCLADEMIGEGAMTIDYEVKGKDFSLAGRAASGLKKALKRFDIPPDIIRRTTIAVYEAEMNIVSFTEGGKVRAVIEPCEIQFSAEDSGPGIEDIEKALQPGFSTAPEWVRELGFGAGMGLNNIQKCVDVLNITSG